MQPVITYHRVPLNEYRVIIDLPVAVRKRVIALQQKLLIETGSAPTGVLPHICLAVFRQAEEEEGKITDHIHRVALGAMPFKLHLKDLLTLNAEEIYIGAAETQYLHYLVEQLKPIETMCAQGYFNELPRVPLLRHLPPLLFEQAKAIITDMNFKATFVANGMLLLKQMPGFRSWQVLQHYTFLHMAGS
ncbi:MAG: hypothetical protein QM727_04695 [Niabella sp.]